MKCVNGHEVDATFSFCPICDAPIVHAETVIVNDSQPGWAAAPRESLCPKGHVIPDNETDSPDCARLEVSDAEDATHRLLPFVVAASMMVAAGVVVVVSAPMSWMVASGLTPHSWDAFTLGDGWLLDQGAATGSFPVGTLVVLLGVLGIFLGLLSFTPLMGYRYFRTSAAYLFFGGLPFLLLTFAFNNTVSAINTFNATEANNVPCTLPRPFCVPPSVTGDVATFGPGFWMFLAGIALGTIAASFHYLHQRLSSGETLSPVDFAVPSS